MGHPGCLGALRFPRWRLGRPHHRRANYHWSVTESPELRQDLTSIPSYRAGQRVKGKPGDVFSLASNETVYGPLPGVMHAAQARVESSHRYPDPGASQLIADLASKHGVAEDWVATGTGSVAICQQAVVASCSPGDEVVFAWRSFEAYPIITQLAAAKAVQVPLLPGGEHDLDLMSKSITEKTRVVFICNPNNPTGPSVPRAELEEFLDTVPSRVLIVLDEAYYEFAHASKGSGQQADGVEVSKRRNNVLALRTFSKAYGLAGLRVGYGIAHPDITGSLRKTSLPFGVSAVAQAAAVASLAAEDTMWKRVHEVVAERDRVVAEARNYGWQVPEARGNYYWLPLGERTLDFAQACLSRGVTVRAFPDEGARVTVGEHEANNRVLDVLSGEFRR